MADEYKTAAINWLLLHGRCDWMMQSTYPSLRELADRGIDLDASELPELHASTMVDDGDSFTEATEAEGVSATIVPLNQRNWRDSFTFVVATGPDGERPGLTVSELVREVIEIGESNGEPAWITKLTEHEERMAAARAARELRSSRP